MVISRYKDIDTPALLIDRDILSSNINNMQEKANRYGVFLRPHIKTHRMPEIARMQIQAGARGITVAKVGEAEVMAKHGLKDIFIANEIAGESKFNRIKALNREIDITVGVDSIQGVDQIKSVWGCGEKPLKVLIDIEVGENRSGVVLKQDFAELVDYIKGCEFIKLKGVFSHEGHCYGAGDQEECGRLFYESQVRTLEFAGIMEEKGICPEVVSVGSTPSLMKGEIIKGITEIRPGTYALMDGFQANAIGTYERCSAAVLVTVISMPTDERIITDAGAKALTAQFESKGMCKTKGFGYIRGSNDAYVFAVYDEHGIIYNKELRGILKVGDKLEIVPNHICPVSNLYDKAYLVANGSVVEELEISCRGKSQ